MALSGVIIGMAQPASPVLDTSQARYRVPWPQPERIAVDRLGQLYTTDSRGNVNRYDSLGQFQLTFSAPRPAPVTLLEPWNAVRIFVFYREQQQYQILDRFLSESPLKNFPSELGFVRLATLSNDNNLWVVDDADFSLKKVDWQTGRILLSSPLELLLPGGNYDLSYLREYQNQVYIVDRKSGLLIFDNMGNYQKTWALPGLSYLFFQGENLLYSDDKALYRRPLYRVEAPHKLAELPGVGPAFAHQNRLWWWHRGVLWGW